MILPKQKVPNKEKFKKDETTGLSNLDLTANYYIDLIKDNDYRDEIFSLYRLLDDEINPDEYNYVLNPFNTKIKKYTKFRGRLRNYNIISPVIEMFLSEYGKRYHSPQVMQTNTRQESEHEKELNKFWKGYYAQKSINVLNGLGIETGKESKELPNPEEAKKQFEESYTENRLIEGQEVLEFIIYEQDIADKYIDLYLNYLVCGRPFTYKTVRNDSVDFEIVPPHQLYVPFSKKRIEDRDWAIRKFSMTPNQLLDNYKDFISDELLDKIDDYNRNKGISAFRDIEQTHVYVSDEEFRNSYTHYYQEEENGIECYLGQFKSFKRVGILTYINKIGEKVEREVDDDYKLNEDYGDVKIDYEYKNCIYEFLKVCFDGDEEFIFNDELIWDRSDVNNTSRNKLTFNGITLTNYTGEIKSIVKTGKNYQALFNIIKYNFEQIINKNKDKLAVIPLGLMSKGKKGWDEEKTMYYAEANSTLFIDETTPNAALALQGIKVLDMSLGQYAKEAINLAQTVKQEWWDVVGMNRQRYGETLASDGKANTEQAIYRSSLITENLLRKFEKLQEKDYGGLLDLSKFAFINGKKGKYINNSGREAFLDLNEDGAIYHLESSYDVHVKFSKDEEEKIKKLEGYLFNYSQNNGDLSIVLEALDISSFTMGSNIIKKLENQNKLLEQQREERKLENDRYVADKNNETKQLENKIKKYVADKEYQGVVESASIRSGSTEKEENEEEKELALEKERVEIEKLKAEIEKIQNEAKKEKVT